MSENTSHCFSWRITQRMNNALSYWLFWQCPSESCHNAQVYFGNYAPEVWRSPQAEQTTIHSSPAAEMLHPRACTDVSRYSSATDCCGCQAAYWIIPTEPHGAAQHNDTHQLPPQSWILEELPRVLHSQILNSSLLSQHLFHSGHCCLWASAVLQGQGNP